MTRFSSFLWYKTIGILFLLIIITISCSKKDDDNPNPDTGTPDPPDTEEPEANTCPNGSVFTRAPVNLADLTSMGALGSLIPPGHTFPTPHLYMYVLPGDATSDNETPVYASADMKLKTIVRKYYENMGEISDYTDYDLHFEVCDSLYLYFIHVRDVTHPDIIAAVQNSSCPSSGTTRSYQECHIQADISISLNEEIGTTGHYDARVYGLDVGIRDYRITDGRSAYVNPDRWCNETNPHLSQRCYTACFFDYLEPSLAESYYPYFNNGRSTNPVQRVTEPVCGTVYTDVANTLQGYWFPSQNEVLSETNCIYLGPNDYLGDKYSFSIGNSVPNVTSRVYTFSPETSGLYNRPFDGINDTHIYAYRNIYNELENIVNNRPPLADFYLLVQLSADGESFKIERVNSLDTDSNNWSFSSNAATFYR